MNNPYILFISGFDASGGAGMIADCEVAAHYGCRSYGLITCLTVQNFTRFMKSKSVAVGLLREQWKALSIEPMISVLKVGLLGSVSQIGLVAQIKKETSALCVVDPVVCSGLGGKRIVNKSIIVGYKKLCALGVILCPNWNEVEFLTGLTGMHGVDALLTYGCAGVVITGGDAASSEVKTVIATPEKITTIAHNRIAGSFHGSGCTFASALTCNLIKGCNLHDATINANSYVVSCITKSVAMSGSSLLHRF
ncbi:MAG: bifunctional hydroxymethylpyrimidine kinase/phosphomethylpyrimidine kinase [Methylacidiphilales bacterium]|nr:bifunctional hydroxymethylpyrimidine kinase/phosphomethylpyrimidine kinase [Candidatus Methylacidiphilales bacterium]